MKSSTKTLIEAMKILSAEIQSEDGITTSTASNIMLRNGTTIKEQRERV